IFFIVPHRAIRSADYFAIPSLIFPLAGVVMIAWAMRIRRRFREYGESRFAMASVPGQIGGSLAGSIHVALLIASDCRPTDDSNPESRIVWRLSAKAPGAAGGYRAEFEVPVFQIGA